MSDAFSEQDWKFLLPRIREEKVTPFLGAGACFGLLPLGQDIATEWAEAEGYPLQDGRDLIRVAQYLAVKYDPVYPKEKLEQKVRLPSVPLGDHDEPHQILASLPLPVYLTTNYDDFMVRALHDVKKDPRRDFCRWSALLQNRADLPTIFEREPDYQPTVANPLVFHLHGYLGRNTNESLVLTEDDYLEFLAAVARDSALLPNCVQTALQNTTCLFIGYRLADWNFRVLFQGLRPTITRQKRQSYAVMPPPPPGDNKEDQNQAMDYLTKYFASLNLRVYWGTAREFCIELRRRLSLEAP